jgi:electron transfer flavoprotein alpha subunit
MRSTADIVIVAGCANGQPEKGFYDTLAFVDQLRELQPGSLLLLLLGEDAAKVARDVATVHGLDGVAISGAGLSTYSSEAYRRVLAAELAEIGPTYICTPQTAQGMEWAPAVAAELGGDCLSGVDAIDRVDGRLCFQKDLYGGKTKGRFAPSGETTLITVPSGVFKYTPQKPAASGEVSTKSIDCHIQATVHLGSVPPQGDFADISDANIIVAAGNGIGCEDNLVWIQRLADLFPRAAVAGSRLVCDRGWLDYQQQVGVTGATVAPALYIACGISGASQHRVGMRGSEFVVAINTDANAPMFNEADVCIVEDLTEFIPLVLERCRRRAMDGENEA